MMEQTIYGDILFLVNFTMDFLTLYTVGAVFRKSIMLSRICIASGIGALYGVAMCFVNVSVLVSILFNLCIAFLMNKIAFKNASLPTLSAFYGMGCLLGGVMTVMITWLNGVSVNPSSFSDSSRNLNGGVPLGWLAAVASVTAFAAIAGGRIVRKRRVCPEADIVITNKDGTFSLKGISDSGNLLTEPLSGRPVIILEKRAFLKTVKAEMRYAFENEDFSSQITALRIIPYKTVSGSSVLYGYLPNEIMVNGKIVDAVVAMGKDNFDGKQALIPACLC